MSLWGSGLQEHQEALEPPALREHQDRPARLDLLERQALMERMVSKDLLVLSEPRAVLARRGVQGSLETQVRTASLALPDPPGWLERTEPLARLEQ